MRGLHPDIWERDGEAALRYLLGYADVLARFTQDAASAEAGILSVLSI